MEAMIKKTLGHIQRGDPGRFIGKSVEHKLMFAHTVNRQCIKVAQ